MKGKRPVETPVRTPTVMKSGKASVATPVRTPVVVTSVATPGRTTTTSSGRVREKRWIPTCHYCNKRGHIRPRCYQYLADLRKVGKKTSHSQRSTKQVWMEKLNLHCNMACTSLKAVEDMNVKEKFFCGKQVADMQGELNLCGDVVSNVPTSVQVNDSTTRFDIGGAEESSKKHEERGRIPSFLIFLCLFLAKRGRMC